MYCTRISTAIGLRVLAREREVLMRWARIASERVDASACLWNTCSRPRLLATPDSCARSPLERESGACVPKNGHGNE